MNYLKGLKRTTSGAMEGSPTQKNVAQAGRNGSNNTKSGGKTNRDVGNVRDLDGFNDKDSTKTHLRGSRDSDLVRTPADQNGSHSEPQEPFTCSRSTITAAGAPPSSLQPGPHPHSGEGALLVHPSPAGRHQKGASSDRRKSLVDALREINPGARLRKVLPVGANGAAVGGPAALKANVSESRESVPACSAAALFDQEHEMRLVVGSTIASRPNLRMFLLIPISVHFAPLCWFLRGKGEFQPSVVIVAAPARPHTQRVRRRNVRGDGGGGRG